MDRFSTDYYESRRTRRQNNERNRYDREERCRRNRRASWSYSTQDFQPPQNVRQAIMNGLCQGFLQGMQQSNAARMYECETQYIILNYDEPTAMEAMITEEIPVTTVEATFLIHCHRLTHPSDVSGHVRNLTGGRKASPAKIATAAENGFSDLKADQTWVHSYHKPGHNEDYD